MAATTGHKRKISFADLERTFRASGPMVPPPSHHPHAQQAQVPMNAAQLQAQRNEELRRADVARRISRKPTDRDIPDELAGVIVGDGVERYAKLRDVERRLDSVMMRKRLDIADNLQRRYTRREGVMRIWISNTAEGQAWQVMEEGGMGEDGGFEFGGDSNATFRVKIEGRLLDDPDEEKDKEDEGKEEEKGEEKGKSAMPSQQRTRFSHFFRAITVDFARNPSLQPDGYSAIEWRKPQPGPNNPNYDPNSAEVNFDTLEFERKSDDNINVTINLTRDEKNERFRLSPALAEIIDTEEEDRAGAVQGIWEYCRAMNLQEDEDKRSVVCDEPLRKASFSSYDGDFTYWAAMLTSHKTALQPRQNLLPLHTGPPSSSPAPASSHPTPLYHPTRPFLHQRHAALGTYHLRHPRAAPQPHLPRPHPLPSIEKPPAGESVFKALGRFEEYSED
jgi:SWI/SNF-related matrix-associated actin-dependent regulator of chromatin subfamily D